MQRVQHGSQRNQVTALTKTLRYFTPHLLLGNELTQLTLLKSNTASMALCFATTAPLFSVLCELCTAALIYIWCRLLWMNTSYTVTEFRVCLIGLNSPPAILSVGIRFSKAVTTGKTIQSRVSLFVSWHVGSVGLRYRVQNVHHNILMKH